MAEARSPERQSVCHRHGVADVLRHLPHPTAEIAAAERSAIAPKSRLLRDGEVQASLPARCPNGDISVGSRAVF